MYEVVSRYHWLVALKGLKQILYSDFPIVKENILHLENETFFNI